MWYFNLLKNSQQTSYLIAYLVLYDFYCIIRFYRYYHYFSFLPWNFPDFSIGFKLLIFYIVWTLFVIAVEHCLRRNIRNERRKSYLDVFFSRKFVTFWMEWLIEWYRFLLILIWYTRIVALSKFFLNTNMIQKPFFCKSWYKLVSV